MDSATTQTDKVLLTLFVSVLVAFITAALSIVRLVNDKENKTTDYRQAWTDSLRKCFAELISNTNLLASCLTVRLSVADKANSLTNHEIENSETLPTSTFENFRSYLDKKLHDEDSHIRDVRRDLHQSYALTRLHFKPNDLSFSRVEQKFDVVVEMLEKLSTLDSKSAEADRRILREKIHAAATEMTAYSRDILKTEWEAVKKGERAYQQTKRWSFIGGGIALFILLIFGIITGWTMLRANTTASSTDNKIIMSSKPSTQFTINDATIPHQPILDPIPKNNQIVNIYQNSNCSRTLRPATPAVNRPDEEPCTITEK